MGHIHMMHAVRQRNTPQMFQSPALFHYPEHFNTSPAATAVFKDTGEEIASGEIEATPLRQYPVEGHVGHLFHGAAAGIETKQGDRCAAVKAGAVLREYRSAHIDRGHQPAVAADRQALGGNMRVCVVAPGITDTPMFRRATGSNPQAVARANDLVRGLKRVAQPEEVARVALWLASDDAAYITGTTVLADGGLLTGFS